MLYITWITDKLGHPHAVWNATKLMGSGLVGNQEMDELSGRATPIGSTGHRSSGQVTIAPMPKARLDRYTRN